MQVLLPGIAPGLAHEARTIVAVVGTMLPLAIAVVAAGRWASTDRVLASIRADVWRWTDIVVGVFAGIALRAVVELFWPTVGPAVPGGIVGVMVIAIAAVVVAPVIEEAFFRGLLLGALRDLAARRGRFVADTMSVLVSTAAFVALHAAAMPTAPESLVGIAIIGAGFGAIFVDTGRLAGPIVAHAVFNGIGAGLLLL